MLSSRITASAYRFGSTSSRRLRERETLSTVEESGGSEADLDSGPRTWDSSWSISFERRTFRVRAHENNVLEPPVGHRVEVQMAGAGHVTGAKRQKERQRAEKRQLKAEKKERRKAEKVARPSDGTDPDIAGIVLGEQPRTE